MQRLLGLLGLTSLVVLTACFYTSNGFAVFLLIVCVALFALSLLFAKLRKEKTIPVGLITAIIAISVFLSYTHIYAEPLQRMYDNKKTNAFKNIPFNNLRQLFNRHILYFFKINSLMCSMLIY